jgi:xanthine dehydrogenase YagS FAD-binding subunit
MAGASGVEHTAPDELIVRARIPARNAYRASTYQNIRDRASYAFALASTDVALDIEGDLVWDARIVIGGVAARPWRARDAERSLIGRRPDERAARHAVPWRAARSNPREPADFENT